MILDSHQHFWKYKKETHSWINDEMAVIRRDFLPEDLEKVYKENKVDGCIAVQADQTIQENEFLIKLSKENSFIKGIVGWVDFQSNTVVNDLEKYQDFSIIKGFRHIVQAEADPNFILRKNFIHGISNLEQYNYVYDILVLPHQLGAVLEFVKLFPNQKFVIDHIAKPYIKDGFFSGWAVLIAEIAKHENVYCKISGMITEADYNTWTPEQIEPYMQLILKSFGSKRIMYGSDWPVCLVAGGYKTVISLTTNFIRKLTTTEQNAIMGNTASEFYNL